ncbi:hypothetical protein BV25DRAFT_1818510 [Artomyces pyxidatus]|uniref:Uncharacterized protein n=1 Tax=Artomyces pyxidatus TaxID=48021 RepID=A0ACB8TI91_9AGAM|nr:hypothetical protein BV25DRAFT_1818510 [Artomyces pyxidatus]
MLSTLRRRHRCLLLLAVILDVLNFIAYRAPLYSSVVFLSISIASSSNRASWGGIASRRGATRPLMLDRKMELYHIVLGWPCFGLASTSGRLSSLMSGLGRAEDAVVPQAWRKLG